MALRRTFKWITKWLRLPADSDWRLSLAAAMLAGGGFVLLISTRQGSSAGFFQSYGMEALQQLVYLIGAYFLMVLFGHAFSYKRLRHIWWALVAAYLGVVYYTALMAPEINGSRAWLTVGPVTLQPSEFGKPLSIFLLALSLHLARQDPWMQSGFLRLYRWPLLFVLANCGALVLQKDFGSLVIFLGLNALCMLIPTYKGIRKGQLGLMMLMLGACIGIGVLVTQEDSAAALAQIPGMSHILVRIENMKDPYQDLQGGGYQPANALYGIGEAGLTGKGLGNSIRKYGYLSQDDSDYIFAIVVEETGVFGILWIVGWYGLLWWELLKYALRAWAVSDQIVLVGTAVYFLLHFVINIGGVGALIPMTGVPLLLFSSGGSALAACAIALGAAQNRIARIVRVEREQLQAEAGKAQSARWYTQTSA